MGQDHHLSDQHKGVDAWKEQVMASIGGMFDTSKATSIEILNVIGGGETPWA